MELLIIGDANSVFVKNLAKHLTLYCRKIGLPLEVDVVHIHKMDVKHDARSSYRKIFLVEPLIGQILRRIPIIRGWIYRVRKRSLYKMIGVAIKEYNSVLVHGLWPKSLRILEKLDHPNIHLVGAFWGSDFYRRNMDGDRILQQVLDRCNVIVISTKRMTQDITSQLRLSEIKVRNILFGLEPLECLFDKLTLSKEVAKIDLGLKKSDFVITCGYCARPEMQHIPLIAELVKIKHALPSNYLLIFPMTYSGNKGYIEEVSRILADSDLRYKVLDNYMSDEEVAYLRLATDIFIQIQTTDANSGSMQEHLLAQNVVITGSWLPYQEYKEKGIYFETINSPDELSIKIIETIENWNKLTNKVEAHNQPSKFRSSLWSEVIVDWFNALDSNNNAKHER